MNLPVKKSLGQHWLDDAPTLQTICEYAAINPGDNILEVGPGHGSLTRILLKEGAQVTAVELDNDLAGKLDKQNMNNLKVVNQDILEFDLTVLPKGYKVAANIPYYLTSNLVRTLSESANPPALIVLLVQKEVAQRICAAPGAMSMLSVSAQVYYECALGIKVPAEKFTPPPKVDSQVVIMKRHSEPLVDENDKKLFFRVVKAGFASRRKTLLNSLSAGFHAPKENIVEILEPLSINTNTRAQELSLRQWLSLTQSIRQALTRESI